MPITRCNSQIPVPLPSPIPTRRGSRSAENEIFSKFLENTLQLPELSLPGPHLPLAPAEIDLRSVTMASTALLLRSAEEFGAFRIRHHGISGNELETVKREAESIFKDSKNVVVDHNGRCGKIIPCVRSSKGALEFTVQNHTHRNFWVHMGNVASILDSIAEQVTLALQQDTSQEFKQRIKDIDSVICLCGYPHDSTPKQKGIISDNSKDKLCDHVLRFYLPMEHCID